MSTQDLNTNQFEAVQWSDGPLLVLAGPGSGKTLVLTLRITRLLKESPDKRFRVLGLTFTNKAAAEMRTRIEQLVPASAERTLLTTFHSFAADVLRQHGSHVGISPDFAILSDEADREEIILSAIRRSKDRGTDLDETDARLLPLITNLAEKLVTQEQVGSRIRDPELRTKVEGLYRAYRDELRTANALDYPSLLAFAYEVLTRVPAVAQQIRIVYPHVCVDEFQDTNLAQYMFLRAIVGPTPKDFFVVADDDQIIYEWNGASPERLRELRKDASSAESVG
jgi:DNA helicase-2/ATP-dependent DNA helicase PcrA